MTPNKSAALKKPLLEMLACLGILLIIVAVVLFASFKPKPADAEVSLSAEIKQAYAESLQLAAVGGNTDAALLRLDAASNTISEGSRNANDIYTKAKLNIYKADIMLTYGFQFKEGFTLLGDVYGDQANNETVRGEALMLAMAHSLQGLDENLLTAEQVRDYVLLNKDFTKTVGISGDEAKLIAQPQDTYKYLSSGFSSVMEMSPSIPVYALARSYSERLLAPFVVPPPGGGYYHSFVASIENTEAGLDGIIADYASAGKPYQEFISTSYYNLARAFETLPQGDVDTVDGMGRIHSKLAAYVGNYPNSSYGAGAYLISISARLVCKVVDEANFNASLINKNALQPYLDEIYASEGWVVPCKEAFEVVAKNIDPRFAKYF